MPDLIPLVALLGIDWADQAHEIALQVGDGAAERHQLPHTPEAIRTWMSELRARCPAGAVGVAIETSRGPLIHALLDYDWVVLYPINPRSLAASARPSRRAGRRTTPPTPICCASCWRNIATGCARGCRTPSRRGRSGAWSRAAATPSTCARS